MAPWAFSLSQQLATGPGRLPAPSLLLNAPWASKKRAKALFLENSMKECTARSSKTIGFFKSLFLRTSNFPIEILKTRFAYVLTGDRLRGLLLAQREALQQSSATHGESAVQSTPLPPGFLPPHPSPPTAKLEDKLQASLSASPFRYLIESGNVVLSLFFFFLPSFIRLEIVWYFRSETSPLKFQRISS